MRSSVVALLATSLALQSMQPAASALAQAAAPFPEVALPSPPRRPYGWAIVAFVAGAGSIGASFGLADEANRKYDAYLRATEPRNIDTLYDGAVHYDRLSTGALVAGESLIAASLYIGFLRRSGPPRLDLSLRADGCALSYRF